VLGGVVIVPGGFGIAVVRHDGDEWEITRILLRGAFNPGKPPIPNFAPRGQGPASESGLLFIVKGQEPVRVLA
jgi:hypothetical protein